VSDHATKSITAVGVAVAASVLGGCLDPLVSDDRPVTSILPPGSAVPSIDAAPALAQQLADQDGVDALIPLRHQFGGGQAIAGWDLGPTPIQIAPLYGLVKRSGASTVPVDHPPIADSIPGDLLYSPYWAIYTVTVSDRYQGEVIASITALDDAVRTGLVEAPVELPLVVNCPAVATDVQLEPGPGRAPIAARAIYYYRGYAVPYFDFGQVAVDPTDPEAVAVAPRYVLAPEGGAPFSEPLRGVDMTDDGDLDDSNDILADDAGTATATAAYQTVRVVVAAATRSIDQTPHDAPQLRWALDLFRGPGMTNPTATVIAIDADDEVRNWPQYRPGIMP
jgi:hypothetical protein